MSAIRLPDGFLDELKARLRPSDIIGRKVKLKKQGKEWVGLSPFTNEKTPSFYVNDQKKIFKCFSSGLGGDVIKFVQETERLSFMEAVEKLAEQAGMALPKATPQEREVYDRRQRLKDVCEAAAQFFEARLGSTEGADARTYLQGRGLLASSWRRYRLGYAPDDWRKTLEHLKAEGFKLDEIVEAGLAVVKDGGGEPYDRFRGRVMFPITDPQGKVIAFGGRGMAHDAKPKYLNSSDTPLFNKSEVLYHYKDAREALGHGEGGGLVVCEGYMDVIALSEAGFGHAVAPLGTALTEQQLAMLWRAGPEPLMCFDGDRAGLGAAYRAIDRALPHLQPGRSLFFCMMPDGMDPDDLIRDKGRQAMADALASAVPLSELLWRRERDKEAVDTPERKAGLDERLKQAAQLIQHAGVRSAYERDLRQRMNDHFWQLRQSSRGKPGAKPSETPRRATSRVQGLGLVVKALFSPDLIERHGEALATAHFADPDVMALRDAVIDLAESQQVLDPDVIRSHLEQSGCPRAAQLLFDYIHPTPPPAIDADGPAGREWLIALEQAEARFAPDEEQVSLKEASLNSAEAQKRLLQQIVEKRAAKARANEAAENADQG